MRAVCFVKRLQWDVPGTLLRHGLIIGDVNNDGDNELVVGTAEGDLYIFKGMELWQKISGLGLITCVTIGDVFNYVHPSLQTLQSETGNDNCDISDPIRKLKGGNASVTNSQADLNILNYKASQSKPDNSLGKMECVHTQRIPTNTKVVLIADVDKDGANELIIGLTDRVVRSYRWSSNADLGTGKLVGLNKWECANQIGTVTLQDDADGTPTLLVAQPGGTFMRIKCNVDDCQAEDDCFDNNSEVAASCVDYQTLGISRMRNPNISTEILGNLTPKLTYFPLKNSIRFVKANDNVYRSPFSNDFQDKYATMNVTNRKNDQPDTDQVDGNLLGRNTVYREYETDKTDRLEFHSSYGSLAVRADIVAKLDRLTLENQEKMNDSELKVKDNNKSWSSGKSYALATLDGTIMLVKDEIILWAMQVDHHISGLCALDVTGDEADEIIVCTWDGQTYILDQQRNSVRFQFEEPVRAFCAGMYSITPGDSSPSLVYNNFANKIFLYYEVRLPSLVVTALNPEEWLHEAEQRLLDGTLKESSDERELRLKRLTDWLLYGFCT
ncbi:KICSTOR complex protein ITFG2-like isoform X2 [Phymastichus coffea]|uniref:KICSTOR complex protein ITFG2-like isoform X2 n=1 Tax=Phymastichus coffea TaxID=108790 RepID=UPI00273C6BB5|nr:KICSTOR complex protein ITFG2-like isoform X2 [Phymastichus coffea]